MSNDRQPAMDGAPPPSSSLLKKDVWARGEEPPSQKGYEFIEPRAQYPILQHPPSYDKRECRNHTESVKSNHTN